MSYSGQSDFSSHAPNSSSSGSQYALCALGVGLVALGVVMIAWSVVPSEAVGNGSRPGPDSRGKTSSVAFVLVSGGIGMLLLSLCLGMRNKRRQLQAQSLGVDGNVQASGENGPAMNEEQLHRYNVPSYEEVVGTSRYPEGQAPRLSNSSSQLPSYEDVLEQGRLEVELEVEGAPTTGSHPSQIVPVVALQTNKRGGRPSINLLNIRRIKSEKLHVKCASDSNPTTVFSIEPLTPPPRYEDKPPDL
ncbi:transmembrane protein 51a [Denticeps clupeoides]|uniref:Transmembrane protein 51 n=1 Tax=Denticeps clupeoides TaxID=299321 RepID=A0AAY4B9K3_9TELE|nr:transmembrane protein 51-like [Denticeps clupeoides]